MKFVMYFFPQEKKTIKNDQSYVITSITAPSCNISTSIQKNIISILPEHINTAK